MKLGYYMISLVAATALAASPLSIEKIVVNSTLQSDSDEFFKDGNLSQKQNTQSYTQKSISTLSTQANMNPYTVIQFSPSVNFTPVDETGSNEPSYHDPIRIRGKSQSGPGGVYMIEGIPLSSNPGGGKEMIDMENVSSIDLYKGYLSVDKNLGFSSLIGKIDMNIMAPSKKAGATVSQSFGSNNFKRTFLRTDTGKIGDFSIFGSFSSTSNEKSKGKGELKRLNGMLGLSYEPTDDFKADLTMVRNSDNHHNYASLSYAQASDLGSYFNQDYAMTQPTASNDVNYYDWNKQSFDTTALFGNFEYKPTNDDKIVFKPYYKKDVGDYWFSKVNSDSTKNRVMDWHMDHDLYGGIVSYEHAFDEALKAKIGYWYHKQLPPGPPTDQKKYKVVNGNLVFDGYGILAKSDHHTIESPFVELSGDMSSFHYSLGMQYQTFTIGAIDSYTGTSSATSQDYDTALATSTYDTWASVSSKTFHTFIPSVYLGYELTNESSLYLDYSRTYGFDVNLYPTYVSNRSTFVSKGVTLQSLWDKLNLETSDNIDLGVKTNVGAVTLNPSLFVSFVKNKQANVYDSQYGVSYPANVGDALGYGAEFAANGPINESLEFLLSLSYNKFAFTQDFQSSSTSTTDIKGNQLPDAPEIMAKGAVSYYFDNWTFTPSVRYTSSRYGDVENTQKMDAFALVDMDASYKGASLFGSNSTLYRITATNLTDEKYISTIITADNVLASTTTSSTYQTGARFGLYGSINLKY
ncbi:TonB-dependent receptor [bacterium]|nr:TonB-dependent receptor [bacterium]MBU1883540.1 TonB-dependent receptor [bacterium]